MARTLVAIVGRPNVGKSTLFNRLVRRKRAIVEDQPGATRDRHFADTDVLERPVTFVDTGGFVPSGAETPLAKEIRMQAQLAVEEADLVLFVVDGRVGLSSEDDEVARYLRKQQRDVLLVVNKVDQSRSADVMTSEFHRLGLGDPLPVSAEHGEGVMELHEAMLPFLKEAPEAPPIEAPPDENRPVRIALVGRPNVGKSTLVNALLGKERMITSDIAGTTRDPIDSALEHDGKPVVLTDTAGIRRKSTIAHRVEQFSVVGALRSAEDADVVVLVLDATEPGVDQDQKIAALAEEKGRALILCVNKWDLVQGTAQEARFREYLKHQLSFVSWAPVIFVSAKTGSKVKKVLDIGLELFAQQYFRAGTPMLNRIVDHITTEHPLPVVGSKQLRVYYASQVATAPPGFAFIVNQPKGVPDRYQRYVGNFLRSTFSLKVPIRLYWRERPGKTQRAQHGSLFKHRADKRRAMRSRGGGKGGRR